MCTQFALLAQQYENKEALFEKTLEIKDNDAVDWTFCAQELTADEGLNTVHGCKEENSLLTRARARCTRVLPLHR